MPYAIYPPIGIARLGNSPDEFFIGREEIDGLGVEIDANGNEQPVTAFKDQDHRVKRQGVRFRIFDVSDPSVPVEATFPEGTQITWTAAFANRKDSIVRPSTPPLSPVDVEDDPARADRAIHASASVSSSAPVPKNLIGTYKGEGVSLGELRLDASANLILLAGTGKSDTLEEPRAPIGGSFYKNPGWYDDVGDGPITAEIAIPGQSPEKAIGAWCITAPPDFSPPSNGIVTLYDVIRQVALDRGWLAPIARPTFETDIRPIIERAISLKYVSSESAWSMISEDWQSLSDPSAANRQLRSTTFKIISRVENVLEGFEIQPWQIDLMEAWVDGEFDQGSSADRGLCDQLTRAALDGALGQGLFPGIEAGMALLDPKRFDAAGFEFRLSHDVSKPGDLTALMAQPWQADFHKCGQNWWPAQRPGYVPTENGGEEPWLRPTMSHERLTRDVQKLGILTPTTDGVVELGRDPDLDAAMS